MYSRVTNRDSPNLDADATTITAKNTIGRHHQPPLPPPHDLNDFVCWWVKEGDAMFPTLNPIVETSDDDPSPPTTSERRHVKSMTLMSMDMSHSPHPQISSYIQITTGVIKFRAAVGSTSLSLNQPLGGGTTTPSTTTEQQITQIPDLKLALRMLVSLKECTGCTTEGLKRLPPHVTAKFVKKMVNEKEVTRVVSNHCLHVSTTGKICAECRKLWTTVYRLANSSTRKRKLGEEHELDENTTAEQKLADSERALENYKREVGRLVSANMELRKRLKDLRGKQIRRGKRDNM